MTDGAEDDVVTMYCRPGSLRDVDLRALERFLRREFGDGGDFVNVYTRDLAVVDRAVRILGGRVEEVSYG